MYEMTQKMASGADIEYCRLHKLYSAHGSRSPAVFLHGWPDSPEMFKAYVTPEERAKPWLSGRDIYTIAFPNRRTNPVIPPLRVLLQGQLLHGGGLQREINALLDAISNESPTMKIVLIAHDWGATCAWSWIRQRRQQSKSSNVNIPVEAFVSLSVGSSFRYDVLEHGLNALQWGYSAVLALGYYVPHRLVGRLIGTMVRDGAGHQAEDIDQVFQDNWHYFYGPGELVVLPLKLIGFRYSPGFTDFSFPVLYIRSPQDRIATTAAFEAHLRERGDCVTVILADNTTHWFPEQQPQLVLEYIRNFRPMLETRTSS